MNKSVTSNLLITACGMTILGFIVDKDEFQGDYGVAAMEFVLMTLILFGLLLLIYGFIHLIIKLIRTFKIKIHEKS